MTDDLSLDLERVASSVPAIPNDYAALRSLIQSLPVPLAPEMRSASAGSIAPASPGMSSASQIGGSMVGGAIGEQSGAIIGTTTYPIAFANMLVNPLLESAGDLDVNMAATSTPWGQGWSHHYVLHSGSAPIVQIGDDYKRSEPGSNEFHSALCYLGAGGAAGAFDITTYLTADSWWALGYATAPFMGAGVVIIGYSIPSFNVLTNTVWLEILDGLGAVVASSPVFDLKANAGSMQPVRLTAVNSKPGDGWDVRKFRLAMRVTTNSGFYPNAGFAFADPILAMSFSASTPPFSPALGKWMPSEVTAYGVNKTYPLMELKSGGLTFDDGSGVGSVSLWRDAANRFRTGAEFEIGRTNTTNVGLLIRRGYDANPALVVYADGKHEWGAGGASAPDVNLYRSAADVLKTDDALVVGARLRTPSEISPAALTATTNDWNPTGLATASVVIATTDGTARSLTGLTAGAAGDIIYLHNTGTATISLNHQNAGSAAANRFTCPRGLTFTLTTKTTVQLIYSATLSTWLVGSITP